MLYGKGGRGGGVELERSASAQRLIGGNTFHYSTINLSITYLSHF